MRPRLRPRFEYVAPCSPSEAAGCLREALGRSDTACRGSVYRGHAVLHVPREEERVWSPFLSVDLAGATASSDGGKRTRVRGLFGPKPAVWSLFVVAYAVCGCLALFALVYGWAQWSLGQSPWAFAVLPASVAGSLIVYGLARYGQRRGREQMEALRRFLEEALDGTPRTPATPD